MKKYFILTFLVFSAVSVIAQSYNLKYDFDKGKTYFYRDVSENQITQQMMGQEMKVTSDSRMLIRVVADENNSEGISLMLSLDSVTTHTSTPQMDTTMVMEQLIGKRTKINVTKKGRITEREIIDSIDANDPLMQMGRREVLTLTKLPEKEIKTGETWNMTDVDSMDMMGGTMIMTSEVEYNLAGKEEKLGYSVLKIPFKSKIKIEGKGTMMGFEFYLEGEGNASGDYYFSPDEGIPVLTEVSQIFDVTMAATGDQNMIIPISQVVKITRNLVE